MKLKITTVLSVLALALMPLGFASAAESTLQISPAVTEVSASAGQTVRVSLSIKNPTNKYTTVKVTANDLDADSQYGISNWFTDANINKTLTIQGGKTIEYTAAFKVPYSAVDRTYSGSVTFEPTNNQRLITASSLIYITVGQPTSVLTVTDLNFGESNDASHRYGVFTATIKNTGEGLSKPVASLKITDQVGNVIETINQDRTSTILPNSSQTFSFAPTKPLPASQLTATVSVTDQLGSYADKAVQLDFSPAPVANNKTTATKNTSDAPWALAAAATLGILLLAIAGHFVKSLIKTKRHKAKYAPKNTADEPVETDGWAK